MTTTGNRRHRPSERGQSLTLLVLTMATMGVMAMLAVTFGQVLVRRHQAQLVVDAAAMAGAAEQAKGLNTIARINKRQYDFLNGLILAQDAGILRGYQDDIGTTSMRMLRVFCGPCVGDDWSNDNWQKYDDDIFQNLNKAAKAVNLAYMPAAKPSLAADKVVLDNFTRSDSLFKSEMPTKGLVIPYHEMVNPESLSLVQLTEPKEYQTGGARHYTPNPGHYASWCIEWYGPVPDLVCIAAKKEMRAAYIKENLILSASAAFGNRPTYHIGNFYATPKTRDIRFTYYLQVPAAKPIFGADYLKEIPKITVMATAKPYAGHLGDDFDENTPWLRAASLNTTSFGFSQQDDKEISPTYRAKLVPVRLVDRLQLAIMMGEGTPGDVERYISVFH